MDIRKKFSNNDIYISLIGLGLLTRFYQLIRYDLWYDEIITWNTVTNFNLQALFSAQYYEPHPPLFFVITHLFTNLLGDNYIAVRLPSFIAGVSLLGLIYYYIGKYYPKINPLRVTALMALSPLLIWYSAEARPYMLTWLFATVFFFETKHQKSTVFSVIKLSVIILIGLLTSFSFVFVVLAIVFFTLVKEKDRSKNVLVSTLFGSAFFLIWVNIFLFGSPVFTSIIYDTNWMPDFSLELFMANISLLINYPHILSATVSYILTGLTYLFLLLLLTTLRSSSKNIKRYIYVGIVILGLVTFVSLSIKPMFITRQFGFVAILSLLYLGSLPPKEKITKFATTLFIFISSIAILAQTISKKGEVFDALNPLISEKTHFLIRPGYSFYFIDYYNQKYDTNWSWQAYSTISANPEEHFQTIEDSGYEKICSFIQYSNHDTDERYSLPRELELTDRYTSAQENKSPGSGFTVNCVSLFD